MAEVCWAVHLYRFLRYCNSSPLEKVVLDCGAGGDDPPLALFHRHGYRTYGVEISPQPLAEAQRYCQEKGVSLNILRGDMRRIPFASNTFSFVYSYNAIFFMAKPNIVQATRAMERVLKPGGLLHINFLSVDDPDDESFSESSVIRRMLGTVRFAKHEDDEADAYFSDFEILHKEKQILEKLDDGQIMKQAYIEYIARRRS